MGLETFLEAFFLIFNFPPDAFEENPESSAIGLPCFRRLDILEVFSDAKGIELSNVGHKG